MERWRGPSGRRGRGGRSTRVALAAVLALLLPGCAGQATTPSTGRPVEGGVATYAEPSSTTPNYIFPFMPTEYLSVINAEFQYLLYRPLYWFGEGGKPLVSDRRSLADQPTFADGNRTVTVHLRPYRWSDGTPVSADGVAFWINMLRAEKAAWGAYVPGGLPDDLAALTVDSPTQVTFHLTRSYSANWFLYNELSQITPLPHAWDRTAAGAADCEHRVSDCPAVHDYLTEQAKSLNDYATNPLWQVVDGPWRLASFNADGHAGFVPNRAHSGPGKPHLDRFEMAPFSDDAAEYNVLRSGNNEIQVGHLPALNAPAIPPGQQVGHNPLESNYTLDRWVSLAVNFFVLNNHNPTVGPIFRQQYLRQAMTSLVDQPSIIKAAVHGYGVPTDGPVPTTRDNTFRAGPNPFPYDPARAQRLLAAHGWSAPPDGVGVCQRPGTGPDQCGGGIAGGARLEFQMQYRSGAQYVQLAMQQLQSSATKVGIRLELSAAPFNTVIGTAIPCDTGKPDCTWQMGNWGGGWTFAPAYFPTGETIFGTGAGSNQGNFSDPRLDQLIAASQTSDDPDALTAYARYGAETMPAIWQPNYDYALTEIANNLKGVTPQSPYLNITPEDWYYVR